MSISIRWKLAGLVASVALVIAIAGALTVPARAADAERAALSSRAQAEAALLGSSVRAAIEFGQLDTAEDALGAALADPLVRWAGIYDERGTRLVRIGPNARLAPSRIDLDHRLSSARGLQLSGQHGAEVGGAPIGQDGSTEHGFVVVALDAAGVSERRAESQRHIFFQAVLVAILGLAVAFFFSHRVSKSLRVMTDAANDIARGEVSKDWQFVSSNDELGEMSRAFRKMTEGLRGLVQHASRIADGDLSDVDTGDGELYVAFRTMVENLRELAQSISDGSDNVAGAAAGMFAAVREQEASTTQQNAALEEIRRALEDLADSANQVASDASQVREMAAQNLASSQRIAEHTKLVSAHSERIGEILQLIQDIADKSDLLALNAALEGTNAGEVGRGFSLVAAEMRRLSEHVMDSVRDIRKLVADTREASHASVLATEEGIKLSRDTAGAAAKISEAAGRQQEGTGQVRDAADELMRVVNDSLSSRVDTTRSGESLLQLSQELKTAAGLLRVDQDEGGPSRERSKQ